MFNFSIKCGIVFTLLSLFFRCTDTQCSESNHFGPSCEFVCHCINNEQCNRTTGDCPTACNFEWAGLACQRKNLVPVGSGESEIVARHSSNIVSNKPAQLAVDGDLSTCSTTNKSTNIQWWRLWLSKHHQIRNISIRTSKAYLVNFKRFQLMVENNPNKYDGPGYSDQQLCYTHSDNAPQSPFIEVKCMTTIYGNQLRILLAEVGMQLVLCDVRIYGECEDGSYGVNCTNKCNSHCEGPCDKDNGLCANCEHGWTGSFCAQMMCADGQYGEFCTFNCSGNCKNDAICRKSDGVCVDGCSPGFKDAKCDQSCENGKYGANCSQSCSPSCKINSRCENIDGTCLYGCIPGYWGQKCENICSKGLYGIDCNQNCSDGCIQKDLDTCNHVDGSCINGCDVGLKGVYCNESCSSNKWGMHCNESCGSCKTDDNCDTKNGTCAHGCASGYKTTHLCKEECEVGSYGYNCEGQCSSYCEDKHNCSHTDGTCENCVAGWTGDKCETECHSGLYGDGCSLPCGNCKAGTVCTNTNGVCHDGCLNGFTGPMCVEECDDGFYGIGCTLQCGNCKPGTVCNKTIGVCQFGCSAGFTGEMCDAACEDGVYGTDCSLQCGNCKQGTVCNTTTGVCHEGCSAGFTGEICDAEIKQEKSEQKGSPVAGIAGGASGAVVVALVVVVVVVVCFKRRHTQKPDLEDTNYTDLGNHQDDERNASVNISKVHAVQETSVDSQGPPESDEVADYINAQVEHGILISKFEAYVKTSLANKDVLIQQFNEIPYGMQHPSNVATRRQNHGKNKYKAMYAYDHSRVILKTVPDKPDSDYINATYILGHSGGKDYIAAQGPIKTSLEDFLRMIWENNVKTIVMATNLSEEGKMKCERYWPEVSESELYGNIITTLETEDMFAEFVVRRMKIAQEDNPDKETLVTQFHYTAWPDKDVPGSTSSLLHFWYQLRKHDGKKTHPWLVHCSAGVGRTGTLIALDILYDQGIDNGSVNVLECVTELRKQRVNMVQTKDQYMYLHKILVEALVLPSKPIGAENFHSSYRDLKEIDMKTRKIKLLLQFETLQDETGSEGDNDDDNERYASAKTSVNRNKNRYDNILAPKEFRPFLLTQVPGCTDYINAVFIPSYRDKFAYIMTQTPLKSTAIDCCRLVYEQEVKVIVTFNENDDNDIGIYLPERESVRFGPFTMSFIAEENKTHFIKRDFQLTFQKEKRSVTQLIFKHWQPSRLTPSASLKMLNFLEELENMRRHYESKPIIVQCLNGAERSGLVVVLMNILERLRFDNEVSIPLVIRQLKLRRQQIIPNFEQFKFCHEVVLSHIESNTTYANM